ncbi:chemotaxis protein CheA [Paludibacterium paludis]|uniref:Chemotaxis protein CheA n=1 Tax=Paludibacterium paludis TaxID=1225769 RepID=A0A918U9Q9_9NEIS|nr:chemotaxis protein CheA [Paludibacterium paludis]GGY13197.1 chemotaxis protein CheA [Paludibacterium paludis]
MDLERALAAFLEESTELLAEMESLLVGAADRPLGSDELNALFRAMHTIKGSAGIFGFGYLAAFAHEAETVLDRIRDGDLALGEAVTGVLLDCHDHVKAVIGQWAAHEPIDEAQGEVLRARLAALQEGATPLAGGEVKGAAATLWRIHAAFDRSVFREGMEPTDIFGYLATLGDIVSVDADMSQMPGGDAFDPTSCYLVFTIVLHSDASVDVLRGAFGFLSDASDIRIEPDASAVATEALPEVAARPADDEPVAASRPVPASRWVKVEASRIDQVIDLVGELVIASSAASLMAFRHEDPALRETTECLVSLVDAIRTRVLGMRMIEIGEIFGRFPRLARDLSSETGKPVHLELQGSETELDKSMVDRLGEPLTHLVRNAIDHGIEPADARERSGKPAIGHVRLAARHEAGSIVIEVSDDGAGLDRERILARARERGLVGVADSPGDTEVFSLIFLPGFSTAEQVTTRSGRGVGMDAVRQVIDELRGTIDIASREGEGTTFRLRLPLTLAIIDGFLVKVAGSAFVIPLERVVECAELTGEGFPAGSFGCHDLRGEILPIIVLSAFFGVSGPRARRRNLVVVRFGEQRAGLVVDELEGECQIVVKPLGELFRHLKALSGSTILGNGDVALILDVSALIAMAVAASARQYSVAESPGSQPAKMQ